MFSLPLICRVQERASSIEALFGAGGLRLLLLFGVLAFAFLFLFCVPICRHSSFCMSVTYRSHSLFLRVYGAPVQTDRRYTAIPHIGPVKDWEKETAHNGQSVGFPTTTICGYANKEDLRWAGKIIW